MASSLGSSRCEGGGDGDATEYISRGKIAGGEENTYGTVWTLVVVTLAIVKTVRVLVGVARVTVDGGK